MASSPGRAWPLGPNDHVGVDNHVRSEGVIGHVQGGPRVPSKITHVLARFVRNGDLNGVVDPRRT